MVNITLSCKNISASSHGFTYPVSRDIPPDLLQDSQCEQAWYSKELNFLSDGQLHANKPSHPLVIDANRENLTLSECIDLHHNVTCDISGQKFHHFYKVARESTSDSGVTEQQFGRSDIAISSSVVIPVIIVLFGILTVYVRRRRRARDGKRSVCGCLQQAENKSSPQENVPLRTNTPEILNTDDESEEGTRSLRDHNQTTMNHAAEIKNSCMNGEAQPPKDPIVTDDEPPQHSKSP